MEARILGKGHLFLLLRGPVFNQIKSLRMDDVVVLGWLWAHDVGLGSCSLVSVL